MAQTSGVLEILESAPLFHGVSGDMLVDNLSKSVLHTLKAGEVLLIPGQANDAVFIVLSGRLNIQFNITHEDPIAVLGEGECVGEMSVLGGAPVSAYAIAATDCKLLAIGHTALWDLINKSHEAAHNMLNILTERLHANTQAMVKSLEHDQGFSGDSMVDQLTGLYNQHWMEQKLDRLLQRAGTSKTTSCLMMLEVDHLKEYSEQYGELGRDQALRDIAHTMLSCLRPDDQAGRHLGERFVAFLPNTTLPDACIAAERLRTVVSESMVVLPSGDALPSVKISLGISHVLPDDTLVRLLARTGKALLMAKDSGGNRVKLVE